MKPPYSPKKSAAKGLQVTLMSLLPVLAAVVGGGLSSPEVTDAIAHAWPALPTAAIVGGIVAALNWLKNRNRR